MKKKTFPNRKKEFGHCQGSLPYFKDDAGTVTCGADKEKS